RARCPSSPARSPAAARRAAGPRGTGLGAAGSRIDRKLNRPETAASRRLMVAGANPDARPLASEITLSCWPARCSAPARGQVAQQRIGVHGIQAGVLPGEPAGEVQQVERVGADAGRGVAAVGQVAEVVVAQLPVRGPPPALDPPAFPAPGNPQLISICHGTRVTRTDPSRST